MEEVKKQYEVVETATNEVQGVFDTFSKASMYLDRCERLFFENTGIPGYGRFKVIKIG